MNRVVDRKTEKHSDELESKWNFERKSIEPVEPPSIFREEHIEVRIEDGLSDQ
jgi:hypothetical protein